jgi:hypothetical protein
MDEQNQSTAMSNRIHRWTLGPVVPIFRDNRCLDHRWPGADFARRSLPSTSTIGFGAATSKVKFCAPQHEI